MNQRELEKAIEREVEEWPGAKVEFASGGKHPKAKLSFGGKMLARPFPGSPSDGTFGIHRTLGDIRRVLKQLGAKRSKPEPTRDEDEAPYRKANEGRDKRPDPVEREPVGPKPDLADKLVEAGAATEEQRTAVQAEGSIATYEKAQRITATTGPSVTASGTARFAAVGGEVYDLESGEKVDVEGMNAEAIRAAAEAIVDGVYFDLPDAVYHAVPRLSASGLQRLAVSPATFWRGSWLDPEAPELDEESTKAQVLGKAYHCARLEPDTFHDRYVRELSKDDFPAAGFLSSDEKVKFALKALGQQQTVTGESIVERCERLIDAGYEGTIWPYEKARWEREDLPGRIPIPAKYFDQIKVDMERIRESEIAELLTGGFAEVSIFWTDRHGIKMKARLDYLVVSHWSDLKTFDNTRGVELETAIANFVRYNRVHIQAATYRDATEAIRTGGLDVQGEASDEQRKLVYDLRTRAKPLACHYIFTEKGGVPNILAKEFEFHSAGAYYNAATDILVEDEDDREAVREAIGSPTLLYQRALWDIDRAKRNFVLYSEVYEPGRPWFPIEARGKLSDLDFNTYWLEGKA